MYFMFWPSFLICIWWMSHKYDVLTFLVLDADKKPCSDSFLNHCDDATTRCNDSLGFVECVCRPGFKRNQGETKSCTQIQSPVLRKNTIMCITLNLAWCLTKTKYENNRFIDINVYVIGEQFYWLLYFWCLLWYLFLEETVVVSQVTVAVSSGTNFTVTIDTVRQSVIMHIHIIIACVTH